MKVVASLGFVAAATAQAPMVMGSAPVTTMSSWSAPAPEVNVWAAQLPVGPAVVATSSGNIRLRTTSKPARSYDQVAFTTGEAVLSATGTKSVPGVLGGAYGNLQLAPGSPDYVGGAAFWGESNMNSWSAPVAVAQTWEAPAAAAWNTWETSAPIYQAPVEIQPAWNSWETPAQPAWNTWEAPAPVFDIYQPAWSAPVVDIYQPAWSAPVDEWWNAAPAVTEWSAPATTEWSMDSWSAPATTEWSMDSWSAPATTEWSMDSWSAPVTTMSSWSAPAPEVNVWAAQLPVGPAVVATSSGNIRLRTTSKPAGTYGAAAFTTGEAVLSATGTKSVPGALGGAYGNLQLAPGSPDYMGSASFWGNRR